MKDRRDPLAKERFLEGNRQKWVAIGLTLGCVVAWIQLLCDAKNFDAVPYLQYFGLLLGAGLLGWSVDSAVKANRVESLRETKSNKTEAVSKIEITGEQVQEFYIQNKHDESYRPPHALAEEYR